MANNETVSEIVLNLDAGNTPRQEDGNPLSADLMTLEDALSHGGLAGASDFVIDSDPSFGQSAASEMEVPNPETGETETVSISGADIAFTDVGRGCMGLTTNNAPTPEEYDGGYGSFSDAAVKQLYEDLCTAVSQQAKAGVVWGAVEGDPDAAAVAVPQAFAHYAAAAIAGFINTLEITIELQADVTQTAAITTTVTTAGTAAAQTGTGIGDITSAIEASTFKVTIGSKLSG